jgi:hypothetical protein
MMAPIFVKHLSGVSNDPDRRRLTSKRRPERHGEPSADGGGRQQE